MTPTSRHEVQRASGSPARQRVESAWNSIGTLERILLDDLARKRNEFAERAAKNVRQHREELARPGAQR